MLIPLIHSYFWYVLEKCKDCIFPPICFSCRSGMQGHTILCSTCFDSLETIAPKLFPLGSRYILTVYPVSRYTNPLRPLLFAKYRSDAMVIEKLADLIWQHSALSLVKFDYLVPIPLHWSRSMQRGFNQSEIIARRLSFLSGLPLLHALKRVRFTHYQVRVEHAHRVENVKNAFDISIDGSLFKDKHIMLVDDSCTTGSTAMQAAKVFVKYKPATISMIVACRAL